MFARMPVLVEQPTEQTTVARLLDMPNQQAIGASPEQALRHLKRQFQREVKRHRISTVNDWETAELHHKNFLVQPTVFHRQRRYPAGPKVALPVRYVELVDAREQLYVLLPDLDEILHVPERKLLRTMLSETIRSSTGSLTPQEIQALWPAAQSEIKWLRLQLADPLKETSQYRPRTLAGVAEPIKHRSHLTMVPGARDRELELLRTTIVKQSCLVVGETGVGKSTLIATIAREMRFEEAPEADNDVLVDPKVSPQKRKRRAIPRFWLSSGNRLIAGMRYLGQWQERLEAVIAELGNIDGILVVENLLDLVSLGGTEPRDSLAAYLIPYLRSGSLRIVAEATPSELDACRRLLPELVDLLPSVRVKPMTIEHEVELLQTTLKQGLQSSQIQFEPQIAECLSRLCRQFQSHLYAPGPSMKIVLDLFGKHRTESKPTKWTVDWLLQYFSQRTGLPLELLDDSFLLHKSEIQAALSKEVIGQETACEAIAGVVTRIKAGVHDPKKPFGCFLLCGPTGVGKTQLAKSLASYLFGAGKRVPLTRLDMSEYSGQAAGFRFLNDSNGNSATWIQQIRNQPLSVVLLDEIEKASPEVFDVLLSLLDEGRLTDRLGRVTSFRNAVVLMTSNLGARTSTSLGFGDERQVDYAAAVRKAFKPEFFNRLDSVIAFSALDEITITKIIEKELQELKRREGISRYGRNLSWTEQLVKKLAQLGVQSDLGARPLQQAVESQVVAPLARWLVEKTSVQPEQILLDWNQQKDRLLVTQLHSGNPR